MMSQKMIKKIFFLVFGVCLFAAVFWGTYVMSIAQIRKQQILNTTPTVYKEYSLEELKKFDGTDPNLPILLALDGLVYDVTLGKDFYQPGGPYHDLAGKDSSVQLNLFGGRIIKSKYPVIGKLK